MQEYSPCTAETLRKSRRDYTVSLLNGAPEEEQEACLRRQREIAAAYERMEEFPNDKCNKQKWL